MTTETALEQKKSENWGEKQLPSPLILSWYVLGPGGRSIHGEDRVIVGAGRRSVGQMRRENRRPVIFDNDSVILGHVHSGGQLVVTCVETDTSQGRARHLPLTDMHSHMPKQKRHAHGLKIGRSINAIFKDHLRTTPIHSYCTFNMERTSKALCQVSQNELSP